LLWRHLYTFTTCTSGAVEGMKTVQKMHATITTCTSGAVEGMETVQKIDANFIGFYGP